LIWGIQPKHGPYPEALWRQKVKAFGRGTGSGIETERAWVTVAPSRGSVGVAGGEKVSLLGGVGELSSLVSSLCGARAPTPGADGLMEPGKKVVTRKDVYIASERS
jgi:hypothetical protein